MEIIAEFRANGGKVGGPFQGSDILLLHHTGARTGTERISPLAFQWVGNSLAVFASKAGAPTHPAWFHNLRANPLTIVEVGTAEAGTAEPGTAELGTRVIRVRARLAQPAERDVIYSRQKQRNPVFAQYEAAAAPRKIPVIVLDPVK